MNTNQLWQEWEAIGDYPFLIDGKHDPNKLWQSRLTDYQTLNEAEQAQQLWQDYVGCVRLWQYVIHQLDMDAENKIQTGEYRVLKLYAINYLTNKSTDLELLCEYAQLPLSKLINYFCNKYSLELQAIKKDWQENWEQKWLNGLDGTQCSFAKWLERTGSVGKICKRKKLKEKRIYSTKIIQQLELI